MTLTNDAPLTNVTKNEIENASWNDLLQMAELILTKLQDGVNTEAVMGSTSTSTQGFYGNKKELVRSVAAEINNFSLTMTIRPGYQEQSYASIATQDLDSLKIPSQT